MFVSCLDVLWQFLSISIWTLKLYLIFLRIIKYECINNVYTWWPMMNYEVKHHSFLLYNYFYTYIRQFSQYIRGGAEKLLAYTRKWIAWAKKWNIYSTYYYMRLMLLLHRYCRFSSLVKWIFLISQETNIFDIFKPQKWWLFFKFFFKSGDRK